MAHSGLRQRRQLESYELDEISTESHQRCKKRASLSGKADLGRISAYCGAEAGSPKLFGVIFPNRSYPMDLNNFTQIDPTHWVLDMSIFVGESYNEVKEICVFLFNEFSIPPEKALTLYVQSPGSHFQYCGAVYEGCPSAVLSLLWPRPGGQMQLTAPDAPPVTAKIGLAVEDVISLPCFNVRQQQYVETLAVKIGESLYNFVHSFCSHGREELLYVPMDTLNQWFYKFKEKLRRDANYVKMLLP